MKFSGRSRSCITGQWSSTCELQQGCLVLQEVYEDGAYLVRQGEPGDAMFVVETGEVMCTHRSTGDIGEAQEVSCCAFATAVWCLARAQAACKLLLPDSFVHLTQQLMLLMQLSSPYHSLSPGL